MDIKDICITVSGEMTFAEVLEYISLIDWTILAGIPMPAVTDYSQIEYLQNVPLCLHSRKPVTDSSVWSVGVHCMF